MGYSAMGRSQNPGCKLKIASLAEAHFWVGCVLIASGKKSDQAADEHG
jgi:hypothetical protein